MKAAKAEPRVKLALTHEEIAQMIGTSRETVTRLFAEMKKRQIVQAKGSTLLIRNKSALKALALVNRGAACSPSSLPVMCVMRSDRRRFGPM